ncbi:GtrA family protein [Pseudomonas sp. QE6]|uniref:GtrA family protein n=1 Tax=Pseudomonas sp. QE6 TaxID=3242491 RepID=UPI003527C094
MKPALIYTLLPVIATVANIFCQDMTTRQYASPYHITLPLLIGTGAGLVIKYILDKRYLGGVTGLVIGHVAGDIERGIDKGEDVLYTPGFCCLIMTIIRSILEFGFRRLSL